MLSNLSSTIDGQALGSQADSRYNSWVPVSQSSQWQDVAALTSLPCSLGAPPGLGWFMLAKACFSLAHAPSGCHFAQHRHRTKGGTAVMASWCVQLSVGHELP